jgi:hypothetical protein
MSRWEVVYCWGFLGERTSSFSTEVLVSEAWMIVGK